MRRLLLVIGLLLVSCSDSPQEPSPCTATLTWEMSTEQDLSELSKYTIYLSSQPSTEPQYRELEIDITNAYLITWEARNISSGTHYFYMTSTNKQNDMSPYSNILSKTC